MNEVKLEIVVQQQWTNSSYNVNFKLDRYSVDHNQEFAMAVMKRIADHIADELLEKMAPEEIDKIVNSPQIAKMVGEKLMEKINRMPNPKVRKR